MEYVDEGSIILRFNERIYDLVAWRGLFSDVDHFQKQSFGS